MLAETNRAPFDLPEAEAELVAGFNVEYSSVIFAFFFLGEYSSMILMSVLMTLLFLGGFGSSFIVNVSSTPTVEVFSYFIIKPFFSIISLFFFFKVAFICFLFVLVRANFPRYRYDQLMHLG